MARTPETTDRMKHRYVELTYYLPDDDQCKFYAVVTCADTPTKALENAIEMCLEDKPTARNVEEFMQRIISEERSAEIIDAMERGRWEGWQFSKEVD